MASTRGNCIWRKTAGANWLERHSAALEGKTGGSYAVIERPNAKRVRVEAFCETTRAARELVKAFGGSVEELSSGWQARYFSAAGAKPIRVGARLIVTSDDGDAPADEPSVRRLIIPASAAFGTGEHATTAMSLRMLERATRSLHPGWRMLDAGTGSGILALAGKVFGAGEVIAIDNDALAISVAKENARGNGVRGVTFIVGDVNRATTGKFNLIAANLYSELLVALLPRWRKHLARDGRLILSGVLRSQEPDVTAAIVSNGFDIREIRRRGKWIALLAAHQKAI
jgi:ribosomal protein L11 methyltransferase